MKYSFYKFPVDVIVKADKAEFFCWRAGKTLKPDELPARCTGTTPFALVANGGTIQVQKDTPTMAVLACSKEGDPGPAPLIVEFKKG